ncbi:Zn peptidase [Bifidobacterium animalis subsp. animalis]|uniref:ImmA/IrrE family metallo-endopeptidase n=1 Tax=Bifidobacterium animalis TaxID=28025 RepID=UPI001020B099|nr:ImmA/IrrE family metallo-endopeptidase [Bifidobacterium animalis]RYN12663.1 Zn peptidase [Bifidobacterium animalis subsp. animalis]
MAEQEQRIYVDPHLGPSQAATELLLKTVADEDNRVMLPINVVDIARQLGLEYTMLFLQEDVSGLLVKDTEDGPFKAVVDAGEHEHRTRFTLAHEIGHYIHKYQGPEWEHKEAGLVERRDELSTRGTDPEERWANSFAASLLMPASIVINFWADGMEIPDMARKFNVSQKALEYRVKNLGLR